MRACIHCKTPSRGGEVFIAFKIGSQHIGMRNRRMQIDWHIQSLGTFENFPILLVIKKLPPNVTVYHRAFEAELGYGPLQLFHRCCGVASRQRRESRETSGMRLYCLG